MSGVAMQRSGTVWLVAILTVAVSARLAAYIALPEDLVSDYLAYWTMATSLYDGKGMTDGFNLAFMSAGYPLLLAAMFVLTGKSLVAAHLLNIALAVVTLLMIVHMGRVMFGSAAAGLFGAALWAMYPESIVYSHYLARENLSVALFGLTVIAAMEIQGGSRPLVWSAVAGLTAAAMAVVGTSGLAILPAVCLALAIAPIPRRQRLAGFVVMMAVCVVAVLPWLYRNYLVLGHPVINTNGGFNLYIGNNPRATGYFMSVIDTDLGPGWLDRRLAAGEYATDRTCFELAVAFMTSHPLDTVLLGFRKLALFWMPPLVEAAQAAKAGRAELLMRYAWLGGWLVIVVLALVGVFQAARARNRRIAPLVLAVLLYTALHGVYYVMSRYRLPAMMLLAVLAGGAIDALLQRRARAMNGGATAVAM